jgi:hypothetical protein
MKHDVKKNLMILGNMFVAATVIYSVVRIVQSGPPAKPTK